MTRRTVESVRARRELRAQLTDPGPVLEAAAAFLAVRPRSISETSRRLVRLGYPRPLIDQVVTQLIETEFLDDQGFAQAWVESRDRARPRGEHGLRRELALKGVSRDVVDEVMSQRDEEAAGEDPDLAAAQLLLTKRRSSLMREPDLRKRRSKAYALLARSGFDSETCRTAIASTLDSDDNDAETAE